MGKNPHRKKSMVYARNAATFAASRYVTKGLMPLQFAREYGRTS